MERLPARYLPLTLFGFAGAFLTRVAILRLQQLASVLRIDPTIASLLVYVVWSAAGVALIVWLLSREGFTWKHLGWTGRMSLSGTVAAVTCTLLAIILWLPVKSFTDMVGIPYYWDPTRRHFMNPHSPQDLVIVFVLGVLCVPALEETLFRGYLLSVLYQQWGAFFGLLVHNLVFAAIHGYYGAGLMVYIFVWALFPAWLFLRYRSLYPCLLMHALNNVFVDIVVPMLLFR
jgi:membrane protease YdiL (CAAX protease family)